MARQRLFPVEWRVFVMLENHWQKKKGRHARVNVAGIHEVDAAILKGSSGFPIRTLGNDSSLNVCPTHELLYLSFIDNPQSKIYGR
jgi:hypothetical protein